ncbi:MAG: dihydropyrimidinase [Deltaproteobacteria bacterium]|nr:dihydropyrimidinase [Deltaproteobacteria bacterium]
MKTLIRNGTLVTASDTYPADLLIDGEKIALVGTDLPAGDARVIDAKGKFVLPGGIDAHTHLDLPFGGTVASDDFYTGHKAAAFGGTTCHIDFVIQGKGETLHQAVENWHKKSDRKAAVDYGFHLAITDLNDKVLDEIPSMGREGVTSLKLFMAYKGSLQVDDTTLFKALVKSADAGMLVMVHAENGDAIDVLVKDAVSKGRLTPEWHALTRPDWAEAEATMRAVSLAGVAGAPLYVVHVTCAKAVDQIAYGRARGLKVMGETCTQYFFFSVDDLRRPDGAKWVCSPPVRSHADNEALWAAVKNDTLQTVATDHCPFFFDGTREMMYEGKPVKFAGKELGGGNFSKIPNGVPGIEDRMPILWTHGVGKGRMSMNRLVELCCTNPAKIFGLYPRKGTLAAGADADVVIWDPNLRRKMGVQTSHQRTDYNLYEGWDVTGMPEKVFVRGRLLVDGETWHGEPGSGAWLKRSTNGAVL